MEFCQPPLPPLQSTRDALSCLISCCHSSVFVSICLFICLGYSFELWRWGSVGRSLVPACQHALIWMFLFYFVSLFVCVCILYSVVYQDGFYGADIYVSIIYWYIILHVTPPSRCVCPVALHMQPPHCVSGENHWSLGWFKVKWQWICVNLIMCV